MGPPSWHHGGIIPCQPAPASPQPCSHKIPCMRCQLFRAPAPAHRLRLDTVQAANRGEMRSLTAVVMVCSFFDRGTCMLFRSPCSGRRRPLGRLPPAPPRAHSTLHSMLGTPPPCEHSCMAALCQSACTCCRSTFSYSTLPLSRTLSWILLRMFLLFRCRCPRTARARQAERQTLEQGPHAEHGVLPWLGPLRRR